jgi:hypothetical protein
MIRTDTTACSSFVHLVCLNLWKRWSWYQALIWCPSTSSWSCSCGGLALLNLARLASCCLLAPLSWQPCSSSGSALGAPLGDHDRWLLELGFLWWFLAILADLRIMLQYSILCLCVRGVAGLDLLGMNFVVRLSKECAPFVLLGCLLCVWQHTGCMWWVCSLCVCSHSTTRRQIHFLLPLVQGTTVYLCLSLVGLYSWYSQVD